MIRMFYELGKQDLLPRGCIRLPTCISILYESLGYDIEAHQIFHPKKAE
jgi:hypothetical protein